MQRAAIHALTGLSTGLFALAHGWPLVLAGLIYAVVLSLAGAVLILRVR